mgnify:CR=1 FL=1
MKRYMIQTYEGAWACFMVVNSLDLALVIAEHLRKPSRIVVCSGGLQFSHLAGK